MTQWCACPDCGLIAEIRFVVNAIDEATSEVIEEFVTMCANGHYLSTPSWAVVVDD